MGLTGILKGLPKGYAVSWTLQIKHTLWNSGPFKLSHDKKWLLKLYTCMWKYHKHVKFKKYYQAKNGLYCPLGLEKAKRSM